MPATKLLFYREGRVVPVVEYFDQVSDQARKLLLTAVRLLAEQGHEVRRPQAAHLQDGIHELRVHEGRVQHRLLYFFHGQGVVLLTHGLRKEARVPPVELRRAKEYHARFLSNPGEHCADPDY